MTMDPISQMFGAAPPSQVRGPGQYATGRSPAGLLGPDAGGVIDMVEGPLPGVPVEEGAAPGSAAPMNASTLSSSRGGGGAAGGGLLGPAAIDGGLGATPPDPLMLLDQQDPAQVDAEFWQRHGRAPTELEMEAYAAVPLLQRALGRPPMKIELMQWLNSRRMNPQTTASSRVIAEQEPVNGAVPTGPDAVIGQ